MDVDSIDVAGTWWRHVPGSADVHHRPDHPADNRWQRGSTIDALYLGDTEATVWAEWYRFLAEAGLPPQAMLPRDLWRWDVNVRNVADLSDAGRLSHVRLLTPRPGQGQWAAFQEVGEALWREGYTGVLAPSAARPAFTILCLFRAQRLIDGVEPIPPPIHLVVPPTVPTGMTT